MIGSKCYSTFESREIHSDVHDALRYSIKNFLAGAVGILLTPIRSRGATLKSLRQLGSFLAPFDSFSLYNEKSTGNCPMNFSWQGLVEPAYR